MQYSQASVSMDVEDCLYALTYTILYEGLSILELVPTGVLESPVGTKGQLYFLSPRYCCIESGEGTPSVHSGMFFSHVSFDNCT